MRALLLAVCAVAIPLTAHAQSGEGCPVAPDASADVIAQQASEHYERGSVLYFQGDYEGAVREYGATLCLLPDATDVLYSIGQAYERLLEFEQAIAYYQRYVDARKDATGSAAIERRSIQSRIEVLEGLQAKIQVTTTPAGATVSFTDAQGVRRNHGKPGDKPFEVRAGTYTMRVELAGYEPVEEQIEPRIGQPYSYFFALRPKQGRLVINAEPSDARIFVDDRLVGIGRYDDSVPGNTYQVTVEAGGRITERRQVQVTADRDTEVQVHLPREPSSGRKQLLFGATIAGGLVAGVALNGLQEYTQGGLGALGGMVLGFVGAYFGVPHDITVGESSFIITSGMVGAMEAGFTAGLFIDSANDPSVNSVGAVTIGGMAGGAIFGAATASRFHLDAGDAALLNTGALWGSIAGGLFAAIYEYKPRVGEALVLGGLNLGIITGALLGRRVEVSRGHVALIDLAGFAGMGIAVAMQSAIDDARDISPDNGERSAHFALVGMGVGLAAGAFLTRNLDAPKTPRIAPVINTTRDGDATFGVGGVF